MYKFTAFGETVTVEARDKTKAMVHANKLFTGKLGEGCWFPRPELDHYQWVEGNFFD